MPQLGETVAEGTISSWLKQVGEPVAAGENLFEIETDKVTVEVQAIAAGVLEEIRLDVGETGAVGTVVAILSGCGPADVPVVAVPAARPANGGTTLDPFDEVRTPGERYGPALGPLGLRITPLARRLIATHGVDLEALARDVHARSGARITKADVLGFAGTPGAAPDASPLPVGVHQRHELGEHDAALPLNHVRRRTGARLAETWSTTPHVVQGMEIDFHRVAQARAESGTRVRERDGVRLTYLPFVARAVTLALKAFPQVNAVFDNDRLVLRRDINLGIAIDLDHDGLVVPVIRGADDLNVIGLARVMETLATRARTGGLGPDDLSGATYTITNNGAFGTLFTTPIVNTPQVAILSTDAIHKRAVVFEEPDGDRIAIRPMGIVTQSFDHRAFDGAYAAAFLRRLKEVVETRDWAAEL